jgi:hypothetical protein
MTVQFIRTTHRNGRWLPFTPTAQAFWQQHGAVIGSLLRPEQPLTVAEIREACDEYVLEHIEDGPHPEANFGYVTWVLVHLLHFGLASAVPAPPTPPSVPITGLDWTAVYPTIANMPEGHSA